MSCWLTTVHFIQSSLFLKELNHISFPNISTYQSVKEKGMSSKAWIGSVLLEVIKREKAYNYRQGILKGILGLTLE